LAVTASGSPRQPKAARAHQGPLTSLGYWPGWVGPSSCGLRLLQGTWERAEHTASVCCLSAGKHGLSGLGERSRCGELECARSAQTWGGRAHGARERSLSAGMRENAESRCGAWSQCGRARRAQRSHCVTEHSGLRAAAASVSGP
jgi:hypothetical protein